MRSIVDFRCVGCYAPLELPNAVCRCGNQVAPLRFTHRFAALFDSLMRASDRVGIPRIELSTSGPREWDPNPPGVLRMLLPAIDGDSVDDVVCYWLLHEYCHAVDHPVGDIEGLAEYRRNPGPDDHVANAAALEICGRLHFDTYEASLREVGHVSFAAEGDLTTAHRARIAAIVAVLSVVDVETTA